MRDKYEKSESTFSENLISVAAGTVGGLLIAKGVHAALSNERKARARDLLLSSTEKVVYPPYLPEVDINVDVELEVLGGHFYELYFGSDFGEYKEKFGWSVVLDSAVSNPVIELLEEELNNINISGIHVIAVKQYDREDFEDPPKKQVNICFYTISNDYDTILYHFPIFHRSLDQIHLALLHFLLLKQHI